MPAAVIGISHKTAPVDLREKLSFTIAELEQVLSQAPKNPSLADLVVLSTCNRTEVYVHSQDASGAAWAADFLQRHFKRADLAQFLYTKEGDAMVEHLFGVASGLDSMVYGEHEILKQVKDAYQLSHKLNLTGKLFNVLFQRALYIGKLVRTHTGIAHGALSVGSVAVALAEKIFGNLSESTVLIFGAGKMAEVSARYLLSKKVKRLLVANRTVENARELAKQFDGQALSLEEGLAHMTLADIVITSMASPEPILTKQLMAEAMAKRQNRSLFVIDIAVPRNVDPDAHQYDNLYLYNIDDLQGIVRENMKSRSGEIEKAAQIVRAKSDEFSAWLKSFQAGEEKSLKHGAEHLRDSLA